MARDLSQLQEMAGLSNADLCELLGIGRMRTITYWRTHGAPEWVTDWLWPIAKEVDKVRRDLVLRHPAPRQRA